MVELRHYLYELASNWATLFWVAMLLPDGLGLVLRKYHMDTLLRCLDRAMGGETRRVFVFRSLFVVGVVIAGFLAWKDQYEVAAKYPEVASQNQSLQAENDTLRIETEKIRNE